jgi:hypothetical protein
MAAGGTREALTVEIFRRECRRKTATKKAGARPAFSWIAAYAEINFPNT